MQILSKFNQNKHLTRLYDNSVLSRYFIHHNAQMHIIINSKANKYQKNYTQLILP